MPVYGLFAAAGLMAAMGLSQRTARLAKVDPLAVWDLGMVTVFAAFILSRLLLVVENLRVFLSSPVLLLELPSLTNAGIALTLVVSVLYLRRRKLPLLATLDAIAPCMALVWALLSLGLIAEGTREGMPASVPWATSSAFGRVHPVEVYSTMAALGLCGTLLWMLPHRRRAGEIAARGLLGGGLLLVLLDFFRLPGALYSNAWLDRVEWLGAGMMVAGAAMVAQGLFDRTVWVDSGADAGAGGDDAV